jgi:hypothetical protein
MAQREILENGLDLLQQMRGPGKVLVSTVPAASLPMPVRAEQVIDPTGGAPASGWMTVGATRGGVNVTKRIDKQVYDDIDQIPGEIGQRTTNRGYRISTQIAQVFNRTVLGILLESGTATQVSTTGATQVMIPGDSGSNQAVARRAAVVFPKDEAGKVFMFVFRNMEPAGGDRTIRMDKSDPASPGLELVGFPEIATTIPSEDAYMRIFEII